MQQHSERDRLTAMINKEVDDSELSSSSGSLSRSVSGGGLGEGSGSGGGGRGGDGEGGGGGGGGGSGGDGGDGGGRHTSGPEKSGALFGGEQIIPVFEDIDLFISFIKNEEKHFVYTRERV